MALKGTKASSWYPNTTVLLISSFLHKVSSPSISQAVSAPQDCIQQFWYYLWGTEFMQLEIPWSRQHYLNTECDQENTKCDNSTLETHQLVILQQSLSRRIPKSKFCWSFFNNALKSHFVNSGTQEKLTIPTDTFLQLPKPFIIHQTVCSNNKVTELYKAYALV